MAAGCFREGVRAGDLHTAGAVTREERMRGVDLGVSRLSAAQEDILVGFLEKYYFILKK